MNLPPLDQILPFFMAVDRRSRFSLSRSLEALVVAAVTGGVAVYGVTTKMGVDMDYVKQSQVETKHTLNDLQERIESLRIELLAERAAHQRAIAEQVIRRELTEKRIDQIEKRVGGR